MKTTTLLSLLLILFFSCQKQDKPTQTCELIDIGKIGTTCDSLRAIGQHNKAAQVYYQAGEINQSSELFVYSAWQYGEGNAVDSALLSVKRSIDFGMNDPIILNKLGIEKGGNDVKLRLEVDSLLDIIHQRNQHIENFEIVTAPTDRFWKYFEQSLHDKDNTDLYLSNYICEGSLALKDYYHIRYENVEKMKRVMVEKNPAYYQYLRRHVSNDRLEGVANNAKAMMVRFSDLYPQAVFPKTYIVPDLINGSGTLTELGLFIGVTMFAKSDSMPLENLNDWQKNSITEFENMKYDLVHELMHFQQSYSDHENADKVLGKIIEEGVCDFLVSILTEDQQPSPGVQNNLDYLKDPKNFNFVMKELKQDTYSTDLSKWMHNGGAIKDRPSNLGYTMGYLVCKSYYDKSEDKKVAIYELLNTDNFKKIIEKSDYREIL
ncbi:hypothetical protein MY04_0735 [Flammeovirga sp. MY04]|uniref:gliding motility protein GldB-related protein n=1 Tax=Flammeovirga sp. MY04 TaxID=1191459 RepID=UPI000806366D|nr:hypothetical protein [Flammeovirga sp. MY04]ANQ48117.1 hypothetical protein MY04_0735 [Flammeovirga sp. MY04]